GPVHQDELDGGGGVAVLVGQDGLAPHQASGRPHLGLHLTLLVLPAVGRRHRETFIPALRPDGEAATPREGSVSPAFTPWRRPAGAAAGARRRPPAGGLRPRPRRRLAGHRGT